MKKYAVFSGRARREEYWSFVLVDILLKGMMSIIDLGLGTFSLERGIGLLSGLYTVAVALPLWAVSVRRLHDTDRSGWWLLIQVFPLIGSIVILIFTLQAGIQGGNEYGPDPKSPTAWPPEGWLPGQYHEGSEKLWR